MGVTLPENQAFVAARSINQKRGVKGREVLPRETATIMFTTLDAPLLSTMAAATSSAVRRSSCPAAWPPRGPR